MALEFENISIGVDTEEIERFEKYAQDKDSVFLLKIYTPNEIEYCFKSNSTAKHLAVRFCAKESVYKAFCGFGIKLSSFSEIEIVHDENNVPQVKLPQGFEDYAVKISLSHSRQTAIAQVIAVKNIIK